MLLFLTPGTAEEIKPLTKYSSMINTGSGLAGSGGCAPSWTHILPRIWDIKTWPIKMTDQDQARENNCLEIRTLKTDDDSLNLLDSQRGKPIDTPVNIDLVGGGIV